MYVVTTAIHDFDTLGVWLSPPGFSFQSFEISHSKGFPLQSLTQNHILIESFMEFDTNSFELKFYWVLSD